MKKRLISLIMAAGLIFGQMNFSDAAEISEDTSAIENKLFAFGISWEDIFEGDMITRGSFAKLMVDFLHLYSDKTVNSTRFIDVDVSHRAVSDINCLYDLGYIEGTGSYKYYPDRNITYAEALNIIINCFGYKQKIADGREWAGSVLNTAYELDILEDVSINITDTARKDVLLKIFENALEAEVMVEDSNGHIETLPAFEKLYKIYITEGVVTKNSKTSLVSKNSREEENVVYIDEQRFECNGGYDEYLGYFVKCYYKVDGDDLISVYIEKKDKNRTLQIDGDDVQSVDFNKMLYRANDGRLKNVELEDLKLIYNNAAYTDYGQLSGIVFPGTSVELLDNDGDGKYEIMFILKYDDYYVSNVDVTSEFVYDAENNKSVDLSKDNCDVTIYNENKQEITISEIEKDTVISVAESQNATGKKLKSVYVSKNRVSDVVTAENAELGYEIAGSYYKKSASCTKNILVGQRITAYLGLTGRIVARKVENNEATFAVLYKLMPSEENEDIVTARLYTENGDFEDYKLEKKVRIDNSSVDVSKQNLERALPGGQILLFETDGNKITKIRLPQNETAEIGEFRLLANGTDSLSVRGNNGINVLAGKVAGLKGKTTVMLVPSDITEEEAFGLFDFGQIENMRDKTYEIYTASDSALNMADYVVLYDAAVAVLTDDSDIYVVEDIFTGLDKDGIPAQMVKLSSPEGSLSSDMVVSNSLDLTLTDGYLQVPVTRIQGVELSEIECGDAIAVATNSTGEIIRIEKIYDYNNPNASNARLKIEDNLVDTCHYYPNKYVDMSRLIYTKLEAAADNFIQFKTSVYPTQDDWRNNTNVGWQMEMAIANDENILVYNHETKTSRKIRRAELENYIGKKMIMRVNQCLMQEVIIYE